MKVRDWEDAVREMRKKSETSPYGEVIGASMDRHMPVLEFNSILSEFIKHLGFDHFSFASSQESRSGVCNKIIADNYGNDWKRYYTENDCATVDPLFQESVRSLLPFFWGHDEFLHQQDSEATTMFTAASDHGIQYGITFPVHTNQDETCLLTVSGKRGFHLDNEVIGGRFQQLSTVSNYVSAFLLSQDLSSELEPQFNLSQRQKECLLWTLEGKTSREISKIINRSKATVEFHIQKAIKELDASNKVHAAIIASKTGLI